jgi:outer membrane protein OmpA-like peptidoglycan-associated protein
MLAVGCSSNRKYVDSQIESVRRDYAQQDADIRQEVNEVRNTAEAARSRADLANTTAAEARSLAMGDVEFRPLRTYTTHFASGSAELTAEARAELDQIAAELQANPGLLVDISGFTDKFGSESYNLELGQRRADEVLRYLADRTPGQLRRYAAVSYGEAKPVGERSKDRRVEIALIEQTPASADVAHE